MSTAVALPTTFVSPGVLFDFTPKQRQLARQILLEPCNDEYVRLYKNLGIESCFRIAQQLSRFASDEGIIGFLPEHLGALRTLINEL